MIAFLSPSYLEDDDRVEEYNAAWCLNRKEDSQTRLAPMLCQDITGLPTYMSLIQWVDIRCIYYLIYINNNNMFYVFLFALLQKEIHHKMLQKATHPLCCKSQNQIFFNC